MTEPNGVENLKAILSDQPYLNSPLSVIEIRTILENYGGFMPDEAVMWFREARGQLGPITGRNEVGIPTSNHDAAYTREIKPLDTGSETTSGSVAVTAGDRDD